MSFSIEIMVLEVIGLALLVGALVWEYDDKKKLEKIKTERGKEEEDDSESEKYQSYTFG